MIQCYRKNCHINTVSYILYFAQHKTFTIRSSHAWSH